MIRRSGAGAQPGFVLIEILIALLVLGAGILSMAGLQTASKRALHESWQRTWASTLAQDLLDDLHAAPAENHAGLQRLWRLRLSGAMTLRDGKLMATLADPTICLDATTDGAPGPVTLTLVWRGHQALRNPAHIDRKCGNAPGRYGQSNEYRRLVKIHDYRG